MENEYRTILEYIQTIDIIDTHEHLPYKEEARTPNTDFLREYLSHYFVCDLVSAGLSKKTLKDTVLNPELALAERWKAAEPYWEAARNTGYGRALDRSVEGLYGIDGIRRETLKEVDAAFKKSLAPGHFRKVLKDKCRIKVSLLDSLSGGLNCDRNFFRSVYRLDHYIAPRNAEAIRTAGEKTGISVTSFDDWLTSCSKELETAFEKGAAALKSGLAYERSLHYERVSRYEAERAFNVLFEDKKTPDFSPAREYRSKALEDYMMHFILGLADKKGLTFQFHTGLQEGNGNLISNSDPALMANLFLEYPNVKFDIFHIGYPYQQTLAALAKNFPNVFIDMCWAHIISPRACIQGLAEWLDAVPLNKISAFGGDYRFIDGVYGHLEMAKENIARALAIKVDEGVFTAKRAQEAARMLFYDNPLSIFQLKD